MASPIYDQLNRPLKDLRISVTDRCNFRCPYCMPEYEQAESYSFLNKKNCLTYEEIIRLTKQFVQLGVCKIRLTGGEPLLRRELDKLVVQLAQISGIDDIALTTNGTLLAKQVKTLKNAGLKRITISLDSLNTEQFNNMTGNKGTLSEVLDGIKTAENVGFDSIKINTVIQKNVNKNQILDLVNYFKGTKSILRFIEYMDAGTCNRWDAKEVVSVKEILSIIQTQYSLEPLKPNYFGEVAARYKFIDGTGEIGFITSVTQPFCHSCTRVRLSSDGKLYNCLFATKGQDLRTPLRNGASDKELLKIITNTWNTRKDRYSELRQEPTEKKSSASKIEMFQIGG
ncbi:Cyclic pyranopterin phosphate synthase (MoaA) [hydrothermal vent metagenome]|uniref:GTP 3',8-cyclase n=1 Tax=hydrothermal vent metagenome TaxID=652676 RepID=A0A3B1DN59_9ZZZZ